MAHKRFDEEESLEDDSSSEDHPPQISGSKTIRWRTRWWIYLGLGAAISFIVLCLTVSGFGRRRGPYVGWDRGHVDHTCRGVKVPEARRLFEDDEDLPGDWQSRRLKGASFDPSELYNLKLKGKYEMPYYGSADIDNDVPNSAREAIIFLHGAARNAQDYFCALKEIVEMAVEQQNPPMHDLTDYLIISPKYHYYSDIAEHKGHYGVHRKSDATELFWNGSHPFGDWRGGAAADGHSGAEFNSFNVLDELLLLLSNPTNFPNMHRIVLAGHSAGGQAVQCYALVSHLRPPALAHDQTLDTMKSLRSGIDVRYVVANPSSYGYLNTMRWIYSWNDMTKQWTDMVYAHYTPEEGRKNWDAQSGRRRSALSPRPWGPYSPNYEAFSAETQFICSDERFNDWHYGLNWTHPDFGDLIPYIRMHPHLHRAAEFYGARDVIYLTGQNDTCSDDMLGTSCSSSCWTRNKGGNMFCSRTVMDVRCPAMLQGPNRNQRAHNYMYHLNHHFGHPVHHLYEVPNVGHQAQSMFISALGRKALFESDRDKIKGQNPLAAV